MNRVDSRQDRQRNGCRALLPVEPPQRPHDAETRPGDEDDEQHPAHDPSAGEYLERHGVRLGHRPRIPPHLRPGDLERAGARTATGMVGKDPHRLAPPVQPVVRTQRSDMSRVVHAFAARETVRPGHKTDAGQDRDDREAGKRPGHNSFSSGNKPRQ